MHYRKMALWALVLSCFSPVLARSQTASIGGTVTDSSGALIPHADVTATNTATNASRSAETDESGTYRIPSLSPGIYDVLVQKSGFKSVLYSRVELTVDLVLTLDAKLAPGGLTEHLTVEGDTVAPINLNDAQIGNLASTQQVNDLPLILRDPYQLILLSPGVVQSNSILGGLSVNGSRERNNNFLLDAVDNNDAEIPGLSLPQAGMTFLNPDAVQEFRVITTNYLPEFGRNTGAIVDIVTRSGSDAFHSDLYWLGRYDALGARGFFNHQLNPVNGRVEPKDSYARNNFGGSAGGPLVRHKTFWFANYEGQRFATTLTNSSIVPNASFRTGVFTITKDTKGNPLPQPVPVDVSSPNSANNVFGLPLDPAIQQILALYPAPKGSPVDDLRGLFFFPSRSDVTGDNVSARLDHDFSRSRILNLRYTFNRYRDSNISHTDFLPGLAGTETLQRRQNLSMQLSSFWGQTVTNNLRIGGNRINFPLTCGGANVINSFGPTDAFGRGLDYPLPGLAGFGCSFLADSQGSERFSGTYTLGDSLSWVRGRHSVKIGAEFRDVYANGFNDFASRTTPSFQNFTNFQVPAFQTRSPEVDSNPLLQDMVWSLFGTVGTEVQAQFFDRSGNRTANDIRGFRQREVDAFAQDSYKILPNLTLSYGLRYQFNGVPFEVHHLLSTLFTSPSGSAPFTFRIVGDGKGLPPLYQNDWTNIEPRIGLAWDPFKNGTTSIRAGYGIFHDRMFGQLVGLTRGNPPFQEIFFQTFFTPTSIGPPVSALPLPPTQTASPVVNGGAGIFPILVDRSLRMPHTQSWNLGLQHQPIRGLLVELNYVGSRGTRLLRTVDGNPPQPDLVAQLLAAGVPPNELQFTNLWFGKESGILPFDAVNNNAFFQAEVFTGAASSAYHALQTNVTKRFTRGFSLQGAYTWSHAIDSASDPIVPTSRNNEFPRNSFDLRAERGNSDFDVRHRLTMNYIWELPLGRGRAHVADGAAGRIFEGWQVAGINTFSRGLPYDIFTGVDTAHTGLPQRPDFNPANAPIAVVDPRTQTGPNVGFFPDPPFGRGGNLGRNHFRGPGINNWDMVLQKTTHLGERASVEFRGETYNLFNRVQFNQPENLTTNTGTFGRSTSQVRRPDETAGARQIQLGLKLRF